MPRLQFIAGYHSNQQHSASLCIQVSMGVTRPLHWLPGRGASVPAAGDLGHLGAHQLQHSSGQQFVIGGAVPQLAPGAVAERKQAAVLQRQKHGSHCFVGTQTCRASVCATTVTHSLSRKCQHYEKAFREKENWGRGWFSLHPYLCESCCVFVPTADVNDLLRAQEFDVARHGSVCGRGHKTHMW